MPLMYRSMLENGGKPAVGSSKKHLGVITLGKYADIEADTAGWVHPLTGGMSVSPDLQNLPQHRVPMRLKRLFSAASGKNNLYVWCLGSGDFSDAEISNNLRLRVDKPAEHGIV
ncbi:MAG: hypothetical protein SFX18_07580 [Pirellulales bacterium]|nr:hypothetical protein [Pirellulales bacterium]